MRLRDWHTTLDTLRSHGDPLSLRYTNGVNHEATIVKVLDSRVEPPNSVGLGSINNPLIQNHDGLLVRIDGQPMFISAGLITYMSSYGKGWSLLVYDWSIHNPQYPPELRTLLMRREAELIQLEPNMTPEDFDTFCHKVVEEVEVLYEDDVLPYYKAEAEFDKGYRVGLQFLKDLADTEQFLDIAAAAQYANWQAKHVRDMGGNEADLYELKHSCLNTLIRRYISNQTHEQIELGADEGSLTLVCGIGVRLMGEEFFAYPREFHVPKSKIRRQARRKIMDQYPWLMDEIIGWRPKTRK